MSELHLLRHAKSSWADPDQPDRDRPLAPRGRRAARSVADHLRKRHPGIELVLCSPAVRAVQTLDLLRPALRDRVEVLVEDELYGAGATELLARLQRVPDRVGSTLVVGHNPGLQELAVLLAREGRLRERATAHFPTAILATLALGKRPWSALEPGGADLVSLVLARELREVGHVRKPPAGM